MGTPFYRAPEQEVAGQDYDHKADMYALGIILFEMWRPFNTLAERAYTLKALREMGILPDDSGIKPEVRCASFLGECRVKKCTRACAQRVA